MHSPEFGNAPYVTSLWPRGFPTAGARRIHPGPGGTMKSIMSGNPPPMITVQPIDKNTFRVTVEGRTTATHGHGELLLL
jgi:hypothetical protein